VERVYVLLFDDGEVVIVDGVSSVKKVMDRYVENVGPFGGRSFQVKRVAHRITVSKGIEGRGDDQKVS